MSRIQQWFWIAGAESWPGSCQMSFRLEEWCVHFLFSGLCGCDFDPIQDEVNVSVQQIGDLLGESYANAAAKAEKCKTVNWRSDPMSYIAPPDPEFVPGNVNFSPGWFMQAHEVWIPL